MSETDEIAEAARAAVVHRVARIVEDGLSPFIKRGLSDFHGTSDYFAKENARRDELRKRGARIRPLRSDAGAGRWDYSEILNTIRGLWQYFERAFSSRVQHPQQVLADIAQMVALRDRGLGHGTLGPFSDDDLADLCKMADRVLRAAGSIDAAERLQRVAADLKLRSVTKRAPLEADDANEGESDADDVNFDNEARGFIKLWSFAQTQFYLLIRIRVDKNWGPPGDEMGLNSISSLKAEACIPACTRVIQGGGFDLEVLSDALNNRGVSYLSSGDPNLALADLNLAIQYNPNNAYVVSNRGVAWAVIGQVGNAMDDFERAVRLAERHNAVPLLNRAASHEIREEYDQAIGYFALAIEKSPRSDFGYRRRGIAYLRSGQIARAIADLEEAIRIAPDSAELYANRAECHLESNRTQEALDDLATALQLSPGWKDLYVRKAHVLASTKQYTMAIAALDRAIALDPRDESTFVQRGLWCDETGDHEGAIKDFTRALEIDSNDALIYFYRGLAREGKDDFNGARRDYMLGFAARDNRASHSELLRHISEHPLFRKGGSLEIEGKRKSS